MIKMFMLTAIGAGMAACSVNANAGMAGFYITTASGEMYSVNGNTLAATLVKDFNSSPNEMLYLGDGDFLINETFALRKYNINSDQSEIVFTIDQAYSTGFAYTSGLALGPNGEITSSVRHVTSEASRSVIVHYNLDTEVFYESIEHNESSLLFDQHYISATELLTADFESQTISVLDANTGNFDAIYNVGFGVVSFFESDGAIFALGKEGGLYTFDANDGSTQFVGNITGAGSSLIGATIPSPGTLATIGLGGLFASRRRR